MAQNGKLERRYALLGAEARVKELEAELAEILRLFPDLRSRVDAARPVSSEGRKRRFTPAGKAAISAGMRRYWARKKAAAAKAGKG